jgi:hypothetical protein
MTVLILVGLSAFGQSFDSLRITGSFDNASLEEILTDLNWRYAFELYLPTDSTLLTPARTIAFEQEPLGRALTRLLEGTPLGFLIYRSYLVVIARKDRLDQFYTPVYFEALSESQNPLPEESDDETVAFEIGSSQSISPDGEVTLSGIISDSENGEQILGSTVYFPQLEVGTSTDAEGRFSIDLPIGRHEMTVSYLGYTTLSAPLVAFNDGEIKVSLERVSIALEEVVVEAEAADANVSSSTIGLTRLETEEIRKLPSFMGEVDVLNSLLQQPGVTSVGEGAGGFNVRGGNVDQNLVLMDEMFMFNPTHALGFFSAFNSDLVNSVELYKGYMPAQFGGRLASVLDVQMRDGSAERFKMKGGIGIIAGRLSAEGPIIKDKSSFIAGVRATYSDWILRLINVPEVRRSSAFFYDANLRYTHRFNEKNQLIFSLYSTRDETVFDDEFGFDYGTLGGQLTYKKVFNPNLISTLSATVSQYQATGRELRDSVTSAQLDTRYRYLKIKEVLNFSPNNDLEILGGISGIFYRVSPGDRSPFGRLSTIVPVSLEEEQALESSLFVNANWKASGRFSISAGLRFVYYLALGPKTFFNYQDPENPTNETITGETTARNWESLASYTSLEPRLGLRYSLTPQSSLKAGYSRTAQFISQLANLIAPTPISIWQLSNQYIQPQRAHSFSLGFFQNLGDNLWETSLEGYFRHIDQLTDFKDFAELTANPNIETELLYGVGRAYGLELSLRKTRGTINGWISYTYSRSEQRINEINGGDWYPAYFDQPHQFSIVTSWEPTGRISLVANFNYNTGRPITAPVGRSTVEGRFPVLEFSDRNQVRIPDYHRLDLAFTVDGSYRKNQRFKTSWTFSVYNVYGRRNPYSVFFRPNRNQVPTTTRLAVLGTPLVSLTLNITFQ